MDEMNIVSKFTTSIVSKIITKVLKNKLGYETSINLNEIRVKIDNDHAHICLDAEVDIEKSELARIINSKWV